MTGLIEQIESVNVWKDMGLNIILSIVGLAIFSLYKVREHLMNFNCSIFFKANKPFWIWAICLQILFAFLIAIAPDSAIAIKSITGIDLNETMAFVTSGAALGSAANSASKNKLGRKN